jgi:hypothetical protein
VGEQQLEEMGPIDYIVLEWDGEQPVTGEVMPQLVELVDRGIIRILDLAFIVKDQDGSVMAKDDDLEEAGKALEPGTVAAVLVWENRWAAPVAVALRRSGGQLVASGRIPVQAILGALDATEAVNR